MADTESPDISSSSEAPAPETAFRRWFVLRDLTRPLAKLPAYKRLGDAGFEVFTPLRESVSTIGGKRIRREVPVIHDLLFVRSSRRELDPVIEAVDTLQYRYVKGGAYCEAMTVRDDDMNRFLRAVRSVEYPEYYSPDEISADMLGKEVRIIGGTLDGYSGRLLSRRGSRKKRLLVSLPGLLTAGVEVEPDYIQFV